MIGVLFGKGLCTLGVHPVSVWDYRQEGVCTQDGVCRRFNAKCEEIEHDYRRKDGGGTRRTCNRCNRRRARREGVTDRWFGDPFTAVVVMLVAAESDRENSAMK